MSSMVICPCGPPEHPRTISNPPGRRVIDYRAGDFTSFRRALLRIKDGETQLGERWRRGADGDLAVQIVEWWAYIADILTLYNERIAHQGYLGTADLPESVSALIRLLGYRPRPGIGAYGTVAALLTGTRPITVPKGFQIQSKPGPGRKPQIFEVSSDTTLGLPDVVKFDVPASTAAIHDQVLIRGRIPTVKIGDQLLVVTKGWTSGDGWAYTQVKALRAEKDPRGNNQTRVVFTEDLNKKLGGADATSARLMRGALAAYPWHFSASGATAIGDQVIELQNIVRQIRPGDFVLLTGPSDPSLQHVGGYTELVWYANQSDGSKPDQPPSNPIPILHSELSLTTHITDATTWNNNRSTMSVLYRWLDVGDVIPEPAATMASGSELITAFGREAFPSADSKTGGYDFLIEAADGGGGHANGYAGTTSSEIRLVNVDGMTSDQFPTPLRALFGLLSVSRGETVVQEVLGSGDATRSGQEFVLKKSPLTYLVDPSSSSGENYKSTLRIWVDGYEWTEAASFYDKSATDRVFVTREDDQGKTHVTFGDWVHGRGLPTGSSNVTASYRIGSGAETPGPGTLTVVPKPLPGLKSIRSPVVLVGGSDPDPPDRVRVYGPRSVMAFGRAVSAVDYETIAMQTPSVARARAYWSWDTSEQRNLVKVYVGDTAAAVKAASDALDGAEDPNRKVAVLSAKGLNPGLSLSVRVSKDPHYQTEDIRVAVKAALHDDQTGLFGLSRVRIGEPFYASQVAAACMSVPGVIAVHQIQYLGPATIPGVRWDSGEGNYWALQAENTTVDVTEGGV